MDEGPARERVNSPDSQDFSAFGLRHDAEIEMPASRSRLADAPLFAGLAVAARETPKGCRATIRPPTAPLGAAPESHMDDDDSFDSTDAETPLTNDSVTPALRLSGADQDDITSGRGNFSDIVVCEGNAARLAMLDLRLPSRIGRRASRAMQRAAVGYATEQETGEYAMPELPARGEIAKLGLKRAGGSLPRRIGSGALVPAKLTWMPKDPFGAGVQERAAPRFRWELMLTSACVTAVSVLAVLWLLKSVAA